MINVETILTKDLVIAQEEILLTAVKSHDVLTLDELLHDDLLFLGSDGVVFTKEADLEAHRSGKMVIEKLHSNIEEINIVDNTAVVVILYTTKGNMMGRAIDGQYRYIRIWKQFPEGLKVIGGSTLKV